MTNEEIDRIERLSPGPLVHGALHQVITELREERKTSIHRGLVIEDQKLKIERLKELIRWAVMEFECSDDLTLVDLDSCSERDEIKIIMGEV